MPSQIDSADMKRDVSGLEQKRRMLEQIVDITKAIESLQESLNAVLVMGVASKDLPEDALKLYGALSNSLRNLPIKKIREYYDNLEIIIGKQVNRIMNYASVDFSADDEIEFITLSSEDDAQSPLELLEAFKRTAQTAVSLRVLLRKRGVPTPGSPLPISAQMIKDQLQHLEAQEQQQREKIKTKIEEIKQDVQGMIDNPAYPDGMKCMLREVVGNLERDLAQLARGAPVERLSFVTEIVVNETESVEVEEITIEAVVAPPSENASSFSRSAARWLNSPWEVSWSEVQKGS
jgi:hypothetical protein